MSTITTITGWVGANPTLTVAKNGTEFTTIRVATTDRFRNANQEWVDGQTQWFGVRLFGEFARNAVKSIYRGEPVVVTGRFVMETWETEERTGSSLLLYATSMGHDMSKGRSSFTRVTHVEEVPDDGRTPGSQENGPTEPAVPAAPDGDVADRDPSMASSA